jgi:hypothetical protein
MINKKVLELKHGLMVQNTKDNMLMVKNKEKDNLNGMMDLNSLETF